jgi:hypothetical protein
MAAMGVALALAFCAFAGAHVAILAGLVQRKLWATAVAAAFFWPLAPWEGWRLGMRARTVAWAAALAVYALGVTLAHHS